MKWLLCLLFISSTAVGQTPFIEVDLKRELGEMKPIWAWFGYDEPNYTYMKDGKKLLSELAALSPVPSSASTMSASENSENFTLVQSSSETL